MAFISIQPAAAEESILTPVLTLKGHMQPPSISCFLDGKQMISGSDDGTARRWDLEAGKEIKVQSLQDVYEQKVDAVAVSRDGQWVGMGTIGDVRVCEVETGIMKRFEGHPGMIDISADGKLLASGTIYSTVRIWSLDTGKLVAALNNKDCAGAIRFSQDSKKIAVISKRWLEIWDVQTQKLDARQYRFQRSRMFPTPILWTTKDKTIVTAFGFVNFHFPNTIYEFDASTLLTVGTSFQGHTNDIDGLALSFDCALLASASKDHTIKLWAFESRQLLASFHVQNPRIIIFSPDSCQLAYTTWCESNIYICNTPSKILPARQVPQRTRASAPIHTPRAHLSNSDAVRHRNTTIDWAGPQTPREPSWMASPFSRGGGWTVKHAGTSHIQPANMRLPTINTWWSPTDMQRQHYNDLQLLPQDLMYANRGPALDSPSTTIPPVVSLLPLSRSSSPVIGSRLPQYYPNPHELLISSSHTDTVLPIRNHESRDPSPDAMLQNLTGYIIKDGNYPVACGGFGKIWKCTYSIDRRPIKVAVKSLQVYSADQLGAAKMKKIKRITRKLRICAKLKHRNILPVYGYTYGFGPLIALVSPWAENGNLTAYLERVGADLTVLRRFQILRDIIAGLQYLHANSVIHGDFNGPNVLIHIDGTACVADFGLSLMYSEVISASQASWTSTLKGNMRWMAPELLVPEQEDGSATRPSEQSDIFSFGGIMLQVLTNQIPYYYLPNDAAIVLCIARSEKPSRSRYPVLLEQYWQFIEQCWSTDPRDRPSTEAADGVIRNEFYSLSRSH